MNMKYAYVKTLVNLKTGESLEETPLIIGEVELDKPSDFQRALDKISQENALNKRLAQSLEEESYYQIKLIKL